MLKKLGLVSLLALILAACASAPNEPIEPQVEPIADEPVADPIFEEPEITFGEPEEPVILEPIITDPNCLEPCVYPLEAVNDPSSELSQRLIFFDFDQSTIRSEFNYILEQHAIYLKSHPSVNIRLEGHTDERGSREYNIALGEQRALSVRQVLLLQGVLSDQITTVSFGEELPLDLGRDETAWSQNRRVEIVYE